MKIRINCVCTWITHYYYSFILQYTVYHSNRRYHNVSFFQYCAAIIVTWAVTLGSTWSIFHLTLSNENINPKLWDTTWILSLGICHLCKKKTNENFPLPFWYNALWVKCCPLSDCSTAARGRLHCFSLSLAGLTLWFTWRSCSRRLSQVHILLCVDDDGIINTAHITQQ